MFALKEGNAEELFDVVFEDALEWDEHEVTICDTLSVVKVTKLLEMAVAGTVRRIYTRQSLTSVAVLSTAKIIGFHRNFAATAAKVLVPVAPLC
jgi:hypothetical protein